MRRASGGRMVALLFVVAAVTRLAAAGATPWDWDEWLFSSAVLDFDVAAQRPHPPGFPLYVLAGRALHAVGVPEFRALQAVSIVSGMLLVPAALFFFLAAGLGPATAAAASMLLAFFPNVWFFGGGAFSDVPSLTLVLAAAGLLLRGRTSARSFFAGAALLALAASVRPQSLLIGMIPALAAVVSRWKANGRRSLAGTCAAIVTGMTILAAFYGWAAAESGGWSRYADALARHETYIRSTDSFLSATRRPLHRVFDDFFVRPYRAPLVNALVTAASLAGVVAALRRRDRGMLLVAAAFAPFALFAWLFLDHFSASRFSIGYAPLVAALAAFGTEAAVAPLPAVARSLAQLTLAAALTVIMALWAYPALAFVRAHRSPTLQSMEWIRAHVPRDATVYVHQTMLAFAAHTLGEYRRVATPLHVPSEPFPPGDAWVVTEGRIPAAVSFSWPKGRLWALARERYFDVSVLPVRRYVTFGSGWYAAEWDSTSTWRWMGRGATATLEPRGGEALLTFHVMPPDDLPKPSVVTITIDGLRLDRFALGRGGLVRSYWLAAGDGKRELVIETDQVSSPSAADGRELGLRLGELRWQ